MIKKIIITGGLGYIGTELCRIYSGVRVEQTAKQKSKGGSLEIIVSVFD